MDHSDVWGFGNAIYFIAATTAQMTFTSNWVHDAAFNGSTCAYHTDGYGYLNGGAAPNNVLIAGNTVATLGNTHDIAMQQATSGYSNWIVAGNYLSGDQYAVAWCAPGTVHCTSSTFAFNVYGTDVMPEQGTVYSGGITLGTGSSWNCDTISFLAGTTWTDADGWTPTSGMNGQYWLPSTTPNSATDNGGNTICASPSTYSFDYQNQATSTTSSSKSVTITSFSSGNVTGLYASLVTGTQYAIVSNTCGTSGSPITLNSSSTCTVAVTFTPTSLGAKADTLNFTSTNSPAAISPTPVTLVGLGVTPTQASPSSCSPGSGTYSSTQHPACTNPNSGTTVQCYATGGTTPATNGLGTGCTTGTLLASGGTVTVAANVVLNIIAGTSTLADSPVNSYTYYIQASPATCSPTSGNVPQTVTCTNPNGGTTIACYKTTGNPATNGLGTACAVGSTAYTTSLSVTNPETLSIVAGTSTTIDSPVNSYTYGSVSNTAPAIGMFAQLELP
jgi:hypothetical protein